MQPAQAKAFGEPTVFSQAELSDLILGVHVEALMPLPCTRTSGALARLQDAHGNRWISQTHAPARDLHATRGKQPALSQLEPHRRLTLCPPRHGSVPSSSSPCLR
jgi:hypothetical protein